MNYERFADEYIANHSTFNISYIKKTVENLKQCFGENPSLDLMKDTSIINNLFFVNNNNKVDRNKVVVVKSCLLDFYKQIYPDCEEKNILLSYINNVSLEKIYKNVNIGSTYFTSYENLIDYYNKICKDYSIPTHESLIFIKVISYLSWYGMDNSSMINITKQEIIDGSFINRIPYKINRVNEFDETLKDYATREYIVSFPGCKKMNLKSSAYLLRSAKEASFDNEDAIVSSLRRFNKEVAIYGKTISRTSLKLNGLFCYLEEKYGDNICNFDICYEIKCASSRAYEIKSEYQAWLEWKRGDLY